jgi:cytochrome c peroxidase
VDNPATVITKEKLLEVQAFLESIPVPSPGAFDATKAARGAILFGDKGGCTACHPTDKEFFSLGRYADITANPPQGDLEVGIKVPSLRGVGHTAPYFHDGSAATLADVVDRFDARGHLGLTTSEKDELVEYLKSL